MQELSMEDVECVSGGLGFGDWVAIGTAIKDVVGAFVQGASNLAEFAGKDNVLQAVNGGNLGA